eukprot:m.439149 g.439149  ORF g.439149 m.439149 type:complete len:531 (+) comp18342_c0_seq1:369-1961(+)
MVDSTLLTVVILGAGVILFVVCVCVWLVRSERRKKENNKPAVWLVRSLDDDETAPPGQPLHMKRKQSRASLGASSHFTPGVWEGVESAPSSVTLQGFNGKDNKTAKTTVPPEAGGESSMLKMAKVQRGTSLNGRKPRQSLQRSNSMRDAATLRRESTISGFQSDSDNDGTLERSSSRSRRGSTGSTTTPQLHDTQGSTRTSQRRRSTGNSGPNTAPTLRRPPTKTTTPPEIARELSRRTSTGSLRSESSGEVKRTMRRKSADSAQLPTATGRRPSGDGSAATKRRPGSDGTTAIKDRADSHRATQRSVTSPNGGRGRGAPRQRSGSVSSNTSSGRVGGPNTSGSAKPKKKAQSVKGTQEESPAPFAIVTRHKRSVSDASSREGSSSTRSKDATRGDSTRGSGRRSGKAVFVEKGQGITRPRGLSSASNASQRSDTSQGTEYGFGLRQYSSNRSLGERLDPTVTDSSAVSRLTSELEAYSANQNAERSSRRGRGSSRTKRYAHTRSMSGTSDASGASQPSGFGDYVASEDF